MNFAVNLIFPIKSLLLHDQKLKRKQKLKYLENKKSLKDEIVFNHFQSIFNHFYRAFIEVNNTNLF